MDFNSIKVRLELGSGHAHRVAISFQFHKGAIRTNEALKVAFTGYNFNSIKVRLERYDRADFIAGEMHFNSIKVRLELPSDIEPDCQP